MISSFSKQNFNGLIKRGKYTLALLMLLAYFCNTSDLIAQNKNKKHTYCGIGAEYYLSANAHGGFYSAYLSISKGRGSVMIGPAIQKRTMQVRGAKFCFLYKLAGLDPEDKGSNTGTFGIKLFSYVQYTDQLPLSYSSVLTEDLAHTSSDTLGNINYKRDWNQIKLSTFEAGAGIELHVRIAQAITWRNFLGISGYSHINYVQGMYNPKSGPTLIFGTGINIPRFRM